jgi:hypothetical protein
MLKIYVSVPTNGIVADSQLFFWKRAEAKYKDRIEFIWPSHCVRRIFHDFARNAHAEEFLKSEADIWFQLDSDVVPPDDIFDMALDNAKWDCAGGVYPVFMTPSGADRPQVVFTVYKGRGKNGFQAANIPQSGTDYVDGIGTGCMFVKRHVLEKMQKPYFEFKYEPENRHMIEGEDLGFCMKVVDMGFKFYVDYSMTCKHYKSVCLLDVSNYAQEFAGRSIQQYEAMIRPQVQMLEQALKKKRTSGLIDPRGKTL